MSKTYRRDKFSNNWEYKKIKRQNNKRKQESKNKREVFA